jgi:hypothetical protein
MPRTAIHLLIGVSALLSVSAPTISAPAGDNELFALLLHAEVGAALPCDQASDVGCSCPPLYLEPAVVVPPDTVITVFLIVWQYYCVEVELSMVQTAFQWDPTWTLLGSIWDCQSNQNALPPADPGGPDAGNVSTFFDCATGTTAVVGRLLFRTGPHGCLEQVASAAIYGTHVVDCGGEMDQTGPNDRYFYQRLGAICVGSSPQHGNGCFDPSPVEASTWGAIKASY